MTCTLADLENKVHSHSATLHPGKGTHVKYQEDSGGRGGSLFAAIYSIFLFTHPKKEKEDDKEREGEEGGQTNYLFGKLLLLASTQTTRLHGLSLMKRK